MKQLRLAFGFFTVLPFSARGTIEEVAMASYLLPFVAVFLGGIEGLAGWGVLQLTNAALAGSVVLAAALLLTGLHHADGLADVADAVMAGGNQARRISILKDRTMGIGAIAVLLLTYIFTWSAFGETISQINPVALPWLFISIEVSARMSLIVVAAVSGSSHPGSGRVFISVLKGERGLLALALSAVVLAVLMVPLGYGTPLACAGAAVAAGLLLVPAGSYWFGGANGDLLGASVELGRAAAAFAAAALWLH